MITTSISIDFLKRLYAMPTWAAMEYAFSNHFVPVRTVIDYAKSKLTAGDGENPDEEFIASAVVDESIAESVHRLAEKEGDSSEDELRLFWANVFLAWAYEHRSDFQDFLGVVEEIYTDFDYPSELAEFVRYMPTNAPDLGSREANENRMIASMGRYVAEYIQS